MLEAKLLPIAAGFVGAFAASIVCLIIINVSGLDFDENRTGVYWVSLLIGVGTFLAIRTQLRERDRKR